jgi:hypothetical protein
MKTVAAPRRPAASILHLFFSGLVIYAVVAVVMQFPERR